ncbi:MAG TPA: HAMP domain-containing sensor histidine kinase [Phycisphaerales bacterium]|nr:HAMP domain-containing sensor histidine kinase [Phycisphaerales bacterium]
MRTRLTLWVVAIFSLIHFATTGVYWLYHSSALSREFDRRLTERTLDVVEAIRGSVPGIDETVLELRANRAFHAGRGGNLRAGVFDARGRSVVPEGTMPKPPEGLRWEASLGSGVPRLAHLPLAALSNPDPDSRVARAVVRSFTGRDSQPYLLVVVVGDAYVYRERAAAAQTLALAAVIGLLAATVAGWFIAGIAVAPFERLRTLAQHLRPESLGEKIEVGHSSAEVEELTRELESARGRLEAAFSAQERFLSNVTHEIKTPIAVLLVEAQTLSHVDLPPQALEFVKSAEHEMTRLGQLVEGFLTLTRLRDSKAVVSSMACRANDLVMDSVDDCQLMASQHGVHLRPMLLSDDDTLETEMRGDAYLLTTMLNNLIRNAIRFSPPGETVTVVLERDPDRVRIAVADRGPGIPPDRMSTIFDRFSQAPEEQRRGRGHGLGLAIAQGIAELHAGLIEVANRDGDGCVFTVSLPARTAGEVDTRVPTRIVSVAPPANAGASV